MAKVPVEKMEVQWRRNDIAGPWQSQTIDPTKTLQVEIQNALVGTLYDIRCRNLSDKGEPSDWTTLQHTVGTQGSVLPLVTDLTATAVADGVFLSWTGNRPLQTNAVYEIWRAKVHSNGLGGWVVDVPYAAVGKIHAITFTDGVTDGGDYLYYVVPLTSSGDYGTDSNEVHAKAKSVEDGADVSANAGVVTVQNPKFDQGDKSWTKGAGWTIVQDQPNALSGAWYAKKVGGGDTSLTNQGLVPVAPSHSWVQAIANVWRVAATGTIRITVDWLNQAQAVISTSLGTSINGAGGTSSAWEQITLSKMKAPAGAYFARLNIQVSSFTTGEWRVDSTNMTVTSPWLDTLDDLPNGSLFARPSFASIDTSGAIDTNTTYGAIKALKKGTSLRSTSLFRTMQVATMDFTTSATDVEETFPIDVDLDANLPDTPLGVMVIAKSNITSPSTKFYNAVEVQWAVQAGHKIRISHVTGLDVNTHYTITLAIFGE